MDGPTTAAVRMSLTIVLESPVGAIDGAGNVHVGTTQAAAETEGKLMDVVDLAWERFYEAFGEAMTLHDQRGDRCAIIKALVRARETLDEISDELPRAGSFEVDVTAR